MGEELKNDRDYNNWNIPDEIDEDFNGEAPVSDEEKAKMQEFLGEVKEEKMEKKYMDRGKKANNAVKNSNYYWNKGQYE